MLPLDQNSVFDPTDALRRDRDRWAQIAMDQAEYIRQLEQRLQDFMKAEEDSASLPPENDYQALVKWLAAEKALGNDYYADADFNRTRMCRNLRKILGWEPDQNSLRKSQQISQNKIGK
jgi:hypothetical protein